MASDDEARPLRVDASHDSPVFAGRYLIHAPALRRSAVTHDFVALGFVVGGSATLELRGRWQLSVGDAVLVPTGEPHRLIEADQLDQWGLRFCATCLEVQGGAALLEHFWRVRTGAAVVVRIPEARRAFLESLFVELGRETERGPAGSALVAQSLVALILTEVTRAASQHEGRALGGDLVASALQLIEQRGLGPLALRDVASALGCSKAHLTTVVRKATGRSVGQWIVAHRLAEARRRLLHTDEQVEEIAERVGYADTTHFIRMFRREHGLTPAAWRGRHKS